MNNLQIERLNRQAERLETQRKILERAHGRAGGQKTTATRADAAALDREAAQLEARRRRLTVGGGGHGGGGATDAEQRAISLSIAKDERYAEGLRLFHAKRAEFYTARIAGKPTRGIWPGSPTDARYQNQMIGQTEIATVIARAERR